MTKAQLRRQLLKQRRLLAPSLWQEKSEQICQQIALLPQFKQAKTILAYFSIQQEPDLTPLVTTHQNWGFPRCVNNTLTWYQWQPGESLETGAYNIPEPSANSRPINPSEVDLILVPAVACDYHGYRLGYGGGYYDRFLSSPAYQNTLTLGIIFDFAYLSRLPVESWDIPLKGICTETQCVIFNEQP